MPVNKIEWIDKENLTQIPEGEDPKNYVEDKDLNVLAHGINNSVDIINTNELMIKNKADKTYVDTELYKKPDKTYVDDKDNQLNTKLENEIKSSSDKLNERIDNIVSGGTPELESYVKKTTYEPKMKEIDNDIATLYNSKLSKEDLTKYYTIDQINQILKEGIGTITYEGYFAKGTDFKPYAPESSLDKYSYKIDGAIGKGDKSYYTLPISFVISKNITDIKNTKLGMVHYVTIPDNGNISEKTTTLNTYLIEGYNGNRFQKLTFWRYAWNTSNGSITQQPDYIQGNIEIVKFANKKPYNAYLEHLSNKAKSLTFDNEKDYITYSDFVDTIYKENE